MTTVEPVPVPAAETEGIAVAALDPDPDADALTTTAATMTVPTPDPEPSANANGGGIKCAGTTAVGTTMPPGAVGTSTSPGAVGTSMLTGSVVGNAARVVTRSLSGGCGMYKTWRWWGLGAGDVPYPAIRPLRRCRSARPG